MGTQEMEKPLVCLKVSNSTCSGQHWLRGIRATLNFRTFEVLSDHSSNESLLNLLAICGKSKLFAELGLATGRLGMSQDLAITPKIPECN